MVRVRVEIGGWLKDYFSGSIQEELVFEESVDSGTNLMDLAHVLARKSARFAKLAFKDSGKELGGYVVFILNGKMITSAKDLECELKDGDDVKLIPAMAGG